MNKQTKELETARKDAATRDKAASETEKNLKEVRGFAKDLIGTMTGGSVSEDGISKETVENSVEVSK